eukprot:5639011-Pleurochrysis_carterae.AAC.2
MASQDMVLACPLPRERSKMVLPCGSPCHVRPKRPDPKRYAALRNVSRAARVHYTCHLVPPQLKRTLTVRAALA